MRTKQTYTHTQQINNTDKIYTCYGTKELELYRAILLQSPIQFASNSSTIKLLDSARHP